MRHLDDNRRKAARILLWVFLPMLLLSSVHVHQPAPTFDEDCYACAHHVRHDGHLTSVDSQWSSCVLCHFVSLPYVGGRPVAVVQVHSHVHRVPVLAQPVPSAVYDGIIPARAPPSLLLFS